MGDGNVTVGLDIGTTSVKGLAVDDDGHVLAQVRVPHPIGIPAPDRFEHDANRAWRVGVRQAWREVSAGLDPIGVNVVAMIPSLAAVDARGHALTPACSTGTSGGGGAGGRLVRPATSARSSASSGGATTRRPTPPASGRPRR